MSLRDDLIKSRYLLDGETEIGMWRRVANFVADEKDVDACVKYLSNGDIIFNSPILRKIIALIHENVKVFNDFGLLRQKKKAHFTVLTSLLDVF